MLVASRSLTLPAPCTTACAARGTRSTMRMTAQALTSAAEMVRCKTCHRYLCRHRRRLQAARLLKLRESFAQLYVQEAKPLAGSTLPRVQR
jgi:hypothetical protein